MAGRARGLHTITKRQQLHDRQARARSWLSHTVRDHLVINPRDLLFDVLILMEQATEPVASSDAARLTPRALGK
jgi:hypothetical protein